MMWRWCVGLAVVAALRAPVAADVPRAPHQAGPAATAAASDALDQPAFAASPSALLAAAGRAPAGDWPAVVLRDQRDVSYDEQGRATTRWRVVFVIRTPAGLDDWSELGVSWSPAHEDRPVIRARVIDPAGHPALLAPAQIRDDAGHAPDGRRVLRAWLPHVAVGAVVEQEIVMVDREPLFPAGICDLYPLGRDVPTLATVLSYAAPRSRPLHFVERALPAGVHPRHEAQGSRDRWVYALGSLPAQPVDEPGVPGDLVIAPYVGVSTAASWDVIARAYLAVVEHRIADGPIRLPPGLPHAATLDTVRAITAWLHRHVRYTEVELGAASLVPRPPAETVQRGTGDCKDQAALLVALLRRAGIPAELALLDAGFGRDVDPDLPGMGQFDHAIVRARLGATELWIDPTEPLVRVGQLPARDQGRRALIVAAETRGLVTTPAPAAADNTVSEVRTFVAAASGPARLTEVARSTGVLEAERRVQVRQLGPGGLADAAAARADDDYRGAVTRATAGDPADLSAPFEEMLEVAAAASVTTQPAQLEITLFPRSVLAWLPPGITPPPTAPRVHAFQWHRPYVYEIENRIIIPPGFVLRVAPADRSVALGPATFTERHRIEGAPAADPSAPPGQTLVVTFRFDSGPPRITAAELTALQRAADALASEAVQITLNRRRPATPAAAPPTTR